MIIKKNLAHMDQMIISGSIIQAVKTYFHPQAVDIEFSGFKTIGLEVLLRKKQKMVNRVFKVNEISLVGQAIEGNVSWSEITLDLELKDGTIIKWDEVIKRVWNDEGQVMEEKYFVN